MPQNSRKSNYTARCTKWYLVFLLLTYSFDVELTKMLQGKGVEAHNIISIHRFPEYIQRDYWQHATINTLINALPDFTGTTILLTDCADSDLPKRFKQAGLTIDLTMDMQTSGVNRNLDAVVPDAFFSVSQLPDNTRIIAACLPQHHQAIYQHLTDIQASVTLVLPFAKQGVSFYAPNPTPSLFLSFPHAGHGRFAPVLHSLAGLLNRKQQPWLMLSKNPRFVDIYADAQPSQLQPLYEQNLSSHIASMPWFNYSINHDIYDITALSTHDWQSINIVQLIRDPRDILTSVAMRLDPDNFEATCLRFMHGSFYFKTHENLLYWPSAKTICTRFLFGQQHNQVFTVRFEDLHHQPTETYRALCLWLGWDNPDLSQISAEDLASAIQLGTFAHQTQNQLSRGEKSNILIGSCRKGITGDWKNQWTPALVDAFKHLCNEEFMALGYETDEEWTL